VENPIRRAESLAWYPSQALRLGAMFTAIPVVAGLLFQFTVWPPARPLPPAALSPAAGAPSGAPTPAPSPVSGAAVLKTSPHDDKAGAPVDRVSEITPDPLAAKDDLPDVYRHKCFSEGSDSTIATCVYGDRESSYTVAVVGDSHMGNWIPALQAIATERKLRLVTYLKQSCPFVDLEIAVTDRAQPGCTEWNTKLRARLTGPDRPDLLVTSSAFYAPMRGGKALSGDASREAMSEGLRRTWSAMTSAGITTVVLADTPQLNIRIPDCVSANREKLTKCAVSRELALTASAVALQTEAAKDIKNLHLINLNDAICPTDRCAPVIGGVLVYRDNSHLTASYVHTLTPRLHAALNKELGGS
jgi:hypothetical protein